MSEIERIRSEFICDDRPFTIPPEIAAMSKEELETEYQRIFGSTNEKSETDDTPE
jgi:hypothetical protein